MITQAHLQIKKNWPVKRTTFSQIKRKISCQKQMNTEIDPFWIWMESKIEKCVWHKLIIKKLWLIRFHSLLNYNLIIKRDFIWERTKVCHSVLIRNWHRRSSLIKISFSMTTSSPLLVKTVVLNFFCKIRVLAYLFRKSYKEWRVSLIKSQLLWKIKIANNNSI